MARRETVVEYTTIYDGQRTLQALLTDLIVEKILQSYEVKQRASSDKSAQEPIEYEVAS